MEIPPKVEIPIRIEQGSIYHYCLTKQNKDGTVYNGNRFFIVMNVSPKTDEILVLVTITKKIDKMKKFIERTCEDADTLVSIAISDLSFLSQDSAVNCNNFYPISLEGLINKIENGGKIIEHKPPKTVIDALIRGMMKSNQISPEVKEMLV